MKHIQLYEEFIFEHTLYEELTYESYCFVLDHHLDENIFTEIKDKTIQLAIKVLNPIKEFILKIAKDFNIGLSKIIEAFKQKSVFEFLKAIKFNIGIVFKAFKDLTALIRNGLFKLFEKLAKSGVFEKIRKGVIKIDDFLNEYPIFKKISGPIVAAILIYMWLNMTFIGDFDYDFNFNDIISALSGNFTLSDLFVSPAGLMLITLFITGPYLSVPWLGSSVYNLVVAIFYTGYIRLTNIDLTIKNDILDMAT